MTRRIGNRREFMREKLGKQFTKVALCKENDMDMVRLNSITDDHMKGSGKMTREMDVELNYSQTKIPTVEDILTENLMG